MIEKNGLNKDTIKGIANGDNISQNVRNLIKDYYDFGVKYKKEARKMLYEVNSSLEPKYQFSLELLFDLYLQIFERIDIDDGNFTTVELNPTPEEIKERIKLVVSNFELNSL